MVKNKASSNNTRNRNDLLITAIQQGNFELVKNIVDKAGLNFSEKWLEGYALLCTAIKCHRNQIALWLLSKDCRINRNENDKITDIPIHLAIYNNENDVAKALIEKGASLNDKNHKGETLLHISALKKNVCITELLLKDNEIIADVPDFQSTTPLHLAVEIECLEIVELLLKCKVNVNAYTFKNSFKGFTPLHIAVYKQNKRIVQMLLDNGADLKASIKIPNVNGFEDENLTGLIKYQDFMPLHLASKMNDGDIIQLLADNNADIDAVVENSGMTALHIAIDNKNKANVILFSVLQANFQAVTKEGKNVLHLAVKNDWSRLVEVLIVKGANINSQTVNGETPLYIAVKMGNDSMVKLLLKFNADVNITNCSHRSPLHVAAEYNSYIVKLLLEAGACVDEVNNDSNTPLSIAVKNKNIEIIEQILLHQPCIKNSSNQNAFLFAITNPDHSYVKIVDLLLINGFKITEKIDNINVLRSSILEKNFKLVHYLLKHGIEMSKIQEKYNDLLHCAVRSKNSAMVELLMKYTSNINAADENGETPVGYAIEFNNLPILDLLLQNGANVLNITSSLLNAAKDANITLIQILLKYGADINVSDRFGTTMLHFAVWNKYYNFVEFLLNTNGICLGQNSIEENNEEIDDSYTKEFRRQVFTSPLHIAVSKKIGDICTILLEHHADINFRDGYGRTVLHLASAIKSTEQRNLIKMLIHYGADINALDDLKKLPIYYIYNQTCVCSIAFQNLYEVYSECECDLYEDYDINDVIEVFIKHIMLLVSMNKYVHTDNLKIILKSEFSKNIKNSCMIEIEKMKKQKIVNCLSFYDILVKKSNSLAALARNDDVIEVFELSDYKSKFPLYYELLKEQFDTAKAREHWLQSATVALDILLKFKLPDIISDKVFESLTLNDLKNLSMTINNSVVSNTNPRKKFRLY